MGYEDSRFHGYVGRDSRCVVCHFVCDLDFVLETRCYHLFCRSCFEPLFRSDPRCPISGQTLKLGHLTKGVLWSIAHWSLKSLKIDCDFKSYGCDKVVTLGKLAKHVETCSKNPINSRQRHSIGEFSTTGNQHHNLNSSNQQQLVHRVGSNNNSNNNHINNRNNNINNSRRAPSLAQRSSDYPSSSRPLPSSLSLLSLNSPSTASEATCSNVHSPSRPLRPAKSSEQLGTCSSRGNTTVTTTPKTPLSTSQHGIIERRLINIQPIDHEEDICDPEISDLSEKVRQLSIGMNTLEFDIINNHEDRRISLKIIEPQLKTLKTGLEATSKEMDDLFNESIKIIQSIESLHK